MDGADAENDRARTALSDGRPRLFRLPRGGDRRQAAAGRRRLRPRRRPLRPDERPDVGRPPPAVEGRARRLAGAAAPLVRALPRARRRRRHRRHRLPHRRPLASGARSPSPTSTPRCSPSGASAPRRRPYADRVDFVEANAEELPFDDGALRRRHHRLRHPQRAAHRQGARRGLPRAEARRAVPVPGILRRRRRRPRPRLRALSPSTSSRRSATGSSATASPIAIWSNRSAASPIRRASPP